ncbi:MAG: hypothetical protein LH609_07255 [Rudanella sp.]|nr:hypothetical protein [Rudanella sp.]
MIVLFIKSDLIRHHPLPGHTCPNCHKTDGMDMELRQRYADFAGGKVYPIGVFGVINCLHCGYTLPASRWNERLHRVYKDLRASYKTPVSYWRGAIITVVGLVVGTLLIGGTLSFMGQSQRADIEQQQAAFATVLTTPTPGVTLATIENGQPTYDVWRVSHVNGETVWLKKYTGNRTLTDFYSETGWATAPDSDFSTEAIGYSRTGLAAKGLKCTSDMANKNKPYEAVILAVLDK